MMELRLFVVISLLCFVFCDDSSDTRTLSAELNPGCEKQIGTTCNGIVFLHVRAESAENTLHYIFDFTGTPSIFLATTDKNVSLAIDWDGFMSGTQRTVNFSSSPSFVFSSVIRRIFLFDDPNDKGDVNDASVDNLIEINPHKFQWTKENITMEDDHVMMVMNASVNSIGSFAIKVSAFGSTKHGADLPHLYHSSHSMQIDLIGEKLNSQNYTSARLAVEFLFVTSENKTEGTFKVNKRRNLDDEFTPGIFDVYDIVSPRSNNDSKGAFVQYRPVCYTTRWRTVSDSTELKQGEIHSFNNDPNDIEKFQYTMPYSFYGFDLVSIIAQGSNITLGVPNDGFYSRSNYTSFSMLLGIGSPPVEKLSSFVVTFAAIGLGVPLLVLLVGGTYVGIKRYQG